MTAIYIVTHCGEESSHDIDTFIDPVAAQDAADNVRLNRHEAVLVTSMKLDGARFVPAVEGDPEYANSERYSD